MKAPDQRIAKLTAREVDWLHMMLVEEHPKGCYRLWSEAPKIFERFVKLGYALRIDDDGEPARMGRCARITQAGQLRLLDPQALLAKRA